MATARLVRRCEISWQRPCAPPPPKRQPLCRGCSPPSPACLRSPPLPPPRPRWWRDYATSWRRSTWLCSKASPRPSVS
eukprot:3223194-Prymnesium_polylepis.1